MNIEPVSGADQNVQKLIPGRIDLILNTEYTLPLLIRESGLSMDDFEIALPAVESEPAFIGLNINTPDNVVEELNLSMERLKTWRIVESIYKRFMDL